MTIVKRFYCKSCDYTTPAGYVVDECKCPTCGKNMNRGKYKQYKNHCTIIGNHKHEWNEETGYCTICFDNVHSVMAKSRLTESEA
ncbi:MAG: hypothetical protein WCY05_07435 [Candidatus Omnitrophota bacterium]